MVDRDTGTIHINKNALIFIMVMIALWATSFSLLWYFLLYLLVYVSFYQAHRWKRDDIKCFLLANCARKEEWKMSSTNIYISDSPNFLKFKTNDSYSKHHTNLHTILKFWYSKLFLPSCQGYFAKKITTNIEDIRYGRYYGLSVPYKMAEAHHFFLDVEA